MSSGVSGEGRRDFLSWASDWRGVRMRASFLVIILRFTFSLCVCFNFQHIFFTLSHGQTKQEGKLRRNKSEKPFREVGKNHLHELSSLCFKEDRKKSVLRDYTKRSSVLCILIITDKHDRQ